MDSSSRALRVVPVPAFKDNYVWLVADDRDALVVDPGDAAPVERALAERGLVLRAILLTHHHPDHVGGVAALVAARRGATVEVVGPANERIGDVTRPVRGGERIDVDAPRVAFDVIDVPGHTRGHVAYVSIARSDGDRGTPPMLFSGDTLFAAGCGRLFEGTAEQMHASLSTLAALDPATRVYCGHEYTASNLRFAQAVEPESRPIADRMAEVAATRARGEPTLPSTIALERATNPFFRVDDAAVRAAADRHESGASASPVATFAALRRWKDAF